MDYLSDWQLVVWSLSLCIFAENPKPKKECLPRIQEIPRDEQNRIESNRIKLIDNKVFQVSPIRNPWLGRKKCLPLYVQYPYQVYVRCGFQGLRTPFELQYLVTTFGLPLTWPYLSSTDRRRAISSSSMLTLPCHRYRYLTIPNNPLHTRREFVVVVFSSSIAECLLHASCLAYRSYSCCYC